MKNKDNTRLYKADERYKAGGVHWQYIISKREGVDVKKDIENSTG